MAEGFDSSVEETPPVKAIMERNPLSIAPETSTRDAIGLMRSHKVSCLPVVSEGKLVGIISERDFLPIAYDLLDERLGEE
jgi:CBS domain-containing protein